MCFCQIIPSSMLKSLALHAQAPEHRKAAVHALALSERMSGKRAIRSLLAPLTTDAAAISPPGKYIAIYDAQGTESIPGTIVRPNATGPIGDPAANEAHDGLNSTYDFYKTVFGRESIDGRGLNLIATIHYSQSYDNAYWDSSEMVFGDGDGVIFLGFTHCTDVIGHELTHGVTQYTAGLNYEGQSGALNESMSDCFGSMVKQWTLSQTSDQADWLIGAGLLGPTIHGVALRSMKAPGTAYSDPQLGKDSQPANMKDYVNGWDDNGGVHTNSSIPNHVFYLAAMALGGHSWDKAGPIWYRALTSYMKPDTDFASAADATIKAADELYGPTEAAIVKDAWHTVGVI